MNKKTHSLDMIKRQKIFGLLGHIIFYTRQSLIDKNSSLLTFFLLPQISSNVFSKHICQGGCASAGQGKNYASAG